MWAEYIVLGGHWCQRLVIIGEFRAQREIPIVPGGVPYALLDF